MRLRRKSDGSVAQAFLYKSAFHGLPDWLQPYVDAGQVKPASVDGPMTAQIITGKFWPVFANDWIIAHPEGLYLIEDCDVGQTHDEVVE